MIRTILISATCAVLASSAVGVSHPALEFYQRAPSPPLDIKPGGALPKASPFIRGRLKCARNVNAMLKANGYRGTDSDMARSFLTYGAAVSEPRPGALQIERRGRNPKAGHVQVVSHKQGGVWMCKNPSSRVGDWVLQPCANPRVIAYRIPTVHDIMPTQYAARHPEAWGRPEQRQRARKPVATAYAPPQGIFGASILPAAFFPANYEVRP